MLHISVLHQESISSGDKVNRKGITKAGNNHLRSFV